MTKIFFFLKHFSIQGDLIHSAHVLWEEHLEIADEGLRNPTPPR